MSISSLGYLELFWQRKIVGRGQVSELNFFLDAGKCFFRPEKRENSKIRKLNNSVKNQIFEKIILQFERGVQYRHFDQKVLGKKMKNGKLAEFSRKSVTKNSSHWNSFSLAISLPILKIKGVLESSWITLSSLAGRDHGSHWNSR